MFKKFGFDIDGVTFELMPPLLKRLGEIIGSEIDREEWTDYHTEGIPGVTSETFKTALRPFLTNKIKMQPHVGAIWFIESYFRRTNQRPVFITGRPSKYAEFTYELLSRWLSVPYRLYHIPGRLKYKPIHDEGIEVFIEDRRRTALDLADRGIEVYLMDRPWNREMKEHPNILRVENWFDIGENYE